MITDPILGEIADELYKKDSQRLRIAMKQSWAQRLLEIEIEEDTKFASERQRLDARFYSLAKPVVQPVKEMEYVG